MNVNERFAADSWRKTITYDLKMQMAFFTRNLKMTSVYKICKFSRKCLTF